MALCLIVAAVLSSGASGCDLSGCGYYAFYPETDLDRDGYPVEWGDCNDADADISPVAQEIPYDGIDQDCDGEDLDDLDADGYAGGGGEDCDDADPDIYPGAPEVCDGKVNGCGPGVADDADGDGFVGSSCAGGTDCDDGNASIYPGAAEVYYDDIDEDCAGNLDEWDADGDGETPVFVEGGTDCDDQDPARNSSNEAFIPAGVFVMGVDSDDSEANNSPANEVYLSPYCIDRHETTNSEYRDCVDDHECTAPAEVDSPLPEYFTSVEYDNFPVLNIEWGQALEFCKYRGGLTLPTEAQWEKAARGGACLDGDEMCLKENNLPERSYPWGDTNSDGFEEPPDCTLANFAPSEGIACQELGFVPDNVISRPKGASPYEVLNLSGNAAEWVYDYYSSEYYQWLSDGEISNIDPNGPTSSIQGERVYRGGSYESKSGAIRAFIRNFMEESSYSYAVGFRCARPLDKMEAN